jgi:protein TonB
MNGLAETNRKPGLNWLRWTACLALVVVVHATALLLLRRTIPAIVPATPEAIMMDLTPEPAAPPQPEQRTPPEPAQPEQLIPPQPEQLTPPEPPPPQPAPPDPTPPEPLPIPDVAPPVSHAEVPLPPPRPHIQRPAPRPAMVKPVPQPPAVIQSQPAPVSPPTPSAPPAPPSPQVKASWESQLVAHLARFKRFPAAAQRRGEQGVVTVRLMIDHTGIVLAMAIVQGSGYADLDAEAQAWMTHAQPLPRFPPEMTAQQTQVVVPLHFILQ